MFYTYRLEQCEFGGQWLPKMWPVGGHLPSSTASVVMPWFGSEPRFDPEPAWTRPRFGPRFKEFPEPNLRSGSRFRGWTMGLNLSKPSSTQTEPFWGANSVATARLGPLTARLRVLSRIYMAIAMSRADCIWLKSGSSRFWIAILGNKSPKARGCRD
jgi:hypothetical protein